MKKKPSWTDLKKVQALHDLPDEHLKWIFGHSEYVEYPDSHVIFRTGDPADVMWMMLEGKVDFFMDVNGKLVHYYTFENNAEVGGVGGLLPYSRMKTVPGNSYAVGTVKSFMLHKRHFAALEQLNPDLIQRLVGYMTERARHFATQKLQQEKVSALGQLAAGIAHELNNPAAAISRIASELTGRLMQNYDLTEKLLSQRVNPANIKTIRMMVGKKKAEGAGKDLSAMQRLDREDEIMGWLGEHGFARHTQAAETLAEAGFTTNDLESILADVPKDAFMHVVLWLENLLNSHGIIHDMQDASGRISSLVGAIKSHVHMDRTHEKEPTNIHKDIENTLTLLGHKLREKNIKVDRAFCSNLRDIPAIVGELNQVWTNLIDNAIYAMPKNGRLQIKTSCGARDVNVHIIDNGSGIPADILSRIFDPFFTTKKVGEGTGIGLDLVMRIVKSHRGDIKVQSVPGHTEFTVCLPFPS